MLTILPRNLARYAYTIPYATIAMSSTSAMLSEYYFHHFSSAHASFRGGVWLHGRQVDPDASDIATSTCKHHHHTLTSWLFITNHIYHHRLIPCFPFISEMRCFLIGATLLSPRYPMGRIHHPLPPFLIPTTTRIPIRCISMVQASLIIVIIVSLLPFHLNVYSPGPPSLISSVLGQMTCSRHKLFHLHALQTSFTYQHYTHTDRSSAIDTARSDQPAAFSKARLALRRQSALEKHYARIGRRQSTTSPAPVPVQAISKAPPSASRRVVIKEETKSIVDVRRSAMKASKARSRTRVALATASLEPKKLPKSILRRPTSEAPE